MYDNKCYHSAGIVDDVIYDDSVFNGSFHVPVIVDAEAAADSCP